MHERSNERFPIARAKRQNFFFTNRNRSGLLRTRDDKIGESQSADLSRPLQQPLLFAAYASLESFPPVFFLYRRSSHKLIVYGNLPHSSSHTCQAPYGNAIFASSSRFRRPV